MGSDSAKALRERRYAQRVEVDGHLHSPLAQEHGTPMSYMSYGCRCRTCRTWQTNRCQQQRARSAHNQAVLTETGAPTVATIDPSDLPQAPPVIPNVRARITSLAELRAISDAYFHPDWRAPATGGQGRERRAHGTMQIIVGEDGNVIAFNEREVGTGAPEILAPTRRGAPKVKGTGGGSHGPTSQRALIDLLARAGCAITVTGSGHVKAAKNGRSVVLPSTASDWRSLKNALSDARKQGLLS